MKLSKSKAKSRLTDSNLKNYLLLIALSKKNTSITLTQLVKSKPAQKETH